MITVKVDGQILPLEMSGIRTMGELVELVKMNIDPDAVISGMIIAGRELNEADWRAPLSVQGSNILEIATSTKDQFLRERLEQAPVFVEQIINEFCDCRKKFRDGAQADGYALMGTAVKDLNAFFKWYSIVLETSVEVKDQFDRVIGPQLNTLTKICEQLVQQQLYNSWFAIGDTIEGQLEPELRNLKQSLEQLSKSV